MSTTNKNPPVHGAALDRPDPPSSRGAERRSHDRFPVEWAVDCVKEDTFLYAAITNISGPANRTTSRENTASNTRFKTKYIGDSAGELAKSSIWRSPN